MHIFQEIPWLGYVLLGLAAYLIGAISFTRIMHRLLSGRVRKKSEEGDPEKPEQPPIYSATFIGSEYGKGFGCATSIFDMLKVAIPTLLVRLLFPETVHYLVIALAGIIGNNYPVYYRFNGGAGYSVILGAVLVINWFGVFIANAAAVVLGYFLGSVMVMRIAGNILYIFWFWIYFNDIYHVGFIILANVVFWSTVTRLLMRIPQVKKQGEEEITQEYWSERLLMGGKFGRFMDEYSFPALLKKMFRRRT